MRGKAGAVSAGPPSKFKDRVALSPREMVSRSSETVNEAAPAVPPQNSAARQPAAPKTRNNPQPDRERRAVRSSVNGIVLTLSIRYALNLPMEMDLCKCPLKLAETGSGATFFQRLALIRHLTNPSTVWGLASTAGCRPTAAIAFEVSG